MPSSALPLRLRLGAVVLLASVLPLAVQAPASLDAGRTGGAGSAPAAWLRSQVGSAQGATAQQKRNARARFERALAEAKSSGARTLHDFLGAFLEAHARIEGTKAAPTAGRSTRALLHDLRRQLRRAGLVVRPPVQANAPPTGPQRLMRWAQTALCSSPSDRLAGRGRPATSSASPSLPLVASLQRAVAPTVPGSLIRVLFAGRLLGP
jgi:hypothetical protein